MEGSGLGKFRIPRVAGVAGGLLGLWVVGKMGSGIVGCGKMGSGIVGCGKMGPGIVGCR